MVINPFDFFVEEYAERFPFAYEPSLAADLAPYLRPVDDSDDAGGLARGAAAAARRTACRSSTSSPASTPRSTATSPTRCGWRPACRRPTRRCALGIGSCRDSAWLLVSLLRQYGLAARFVSGYLVQLAADPDSMIGLDGPTGTAQDFTDLHAWAEVFVPGAGWVGLDPTSRAVRRRGPHPALARPRTRARAAPIEGATDPVEVDLLLPQRGAPGPRGPAGHQALHRRRSGRASTRSARPSTSGCAPATYG